MSVKLKDIPGALVEKKETKGSEAYNLAPIEWSWGYNAAITQQGSVKLGLNREKLAKLLYVAKISTDPKEYSQIDIDNAWNGLLNFQKEAWIVKADAICQDLTIIEVVK